VIYKVGLWFAGKFGNGRRRLVQWRRRRCMAVWRASSGSPHGGADWRNIWRRGWLSEVVEAMAKVGCHAHGVTATLMGWFGGDGRVCYDDSVLLS